MLFPIVEFTISIYSAILHALIDTTQNKNLTEIAVHLSEHIKYMELLLASEYSGKVYRKEQHCMEKNDNNLNRLNDDYQGSTEHSWAGLQALQ